MALDPEKLLAHRFPECAQAYVARDAILYALGLGLGADPLDEGELDYLLEDRGKVLPSFAATLASPGMWMRDPAFGVDFARLVHAAQETDFHTALPPSASVRAVPRVASLHDAGAGRGAVLVVERELRDADTGALYSTIRQTLLLRGDGGYGGEPAPSTPRRTMDREADHRLSIAVSSRAALIYRLSGDWNPLHADPAFARAAGFERPILHGLASYGMAGWALMRACGGGLTRLACRFTGPVAPGDRVDMLIWRDGDEAVFEAQVGDRRVLGSGAARLGP